jgi:hypothetical protein
MEEKKKILEMLAAGKISVAEAEQLLAAVGAEGAASAAASPAAEGKRKSPKFLRVEVKSEEENVNVRVPFQLLRAGVKLASLMPAGVQGQVQETLNEKGISLDLSKARPEDLEEMLDHLADLQIDVDGKEQVRIYME